MKPQKNQEKLSPYQTAKLLAWAKDNPENPKAIRLNQAYLFYKKQDEKTKQAAKLFLEKIQVEVYEYVKWTVGAKELLETT